MTLAVGAYSLPIDPASNTGCVTFPANASPDTAEYVLVAQSAASAPLDSAAFVLEAPTTLTPTATVSERALGGRAAPPSTAASFDAFLRAFGRQRAALAPAARPSPAPATISPPVVGTTRRFAVCATLDCNRFDTVTAKVREVGVHVAIYVDTLAPGGGLDSADLDSLRQVMDTLLFPLDVASFGAVSDLDSNGVVIALMTPVVNTAVSRTQCNTSGFVAGFFYPGDLVPSGAPASNRGEIYYSFVPDSTGVLASCAHSSAEVKRLTPPVFVHELQHMINFAQHVLFAGGRAAEEGWLDEGLSKYAEELAGRSFLPARPAVFHQYVDLGDLVDAYEYLSAPGNSFLVIPQDNGTLPEIGASWLFTRYLMDQYGATLAPKLTHTTLTGAANVQAQTGQMFPLLLARWGLANWASDLPGFSPRPELQYSSWSFRAEFDTLHATYPTTVPTGYPLVPVAAPGDSVVVTGWLRAGSNNYARAWQRPGASAFTLFFRGPGGSTLPTGAVPRLTILRTR